MGSFDDDDDGYGAGSDVMENYVRFKSETVDVTVEDAGKGDKRQSNHNYDGPGVVDDYFDRRFEGGKESDKQEGSGSYSKVPLS